MRLVFNYFWIKASELWTKGLTEDRMAVLVNHKLDLERDITLPEICRSLNFTLISVTNEFSSRLTRIDADSYVHVMSASSLLINAL